MYRWHKNRFSILSTWNTVFILVLLLINHYIIFHTINCKTMFATPFTYWIMLYFSGDFIAVAPLLLYIAVELFFLLQHLHILPESWNNYFFVFENHLSYQHALVFIILCQFSQGNVFFQFVYSSLTLFLVSFLKVYLCIFSTLH